MELIPIHVIGQELRTIQYLSARISVPIKQPRYRIIGQTLNLGLSVSVRIQLCQVLSRFFRAGWRSKDVSMHLLSWNSIDFNRVLTRGFLNPQRFDGDVFETSTPTSQHDGATCTCVRTMNNPTHSFDLRTHASDERTPEFQKFRAFQPAKLSFTRTQCDAWLNTTLRSDEMILKLQRSHSSWTAEVTNACAHRSLRT